MTSTVKTRIAKLHSMIALDGRGLEIGPAYNPVVPKRQNYRVQTVDHTTAEGLREKYKNDPAVADKLKNIEDVDYVWTGQNLADLIPKGDGYDYIVASHVIEHMPNLLGFLLSCQEALNEKGVLALAIPDKRYCFDYFRGLSTLGQVLDAHRENRTVHTPGTIFDHASLFCRSDGSSCWSDGQRKFLEFNNTLETAYGAYTYALSHSGYIDAHCWVFTPSSFRLIISDLNDLGLLNLKEQYFFDTAGHEFFVGLSRAGQKKTITRAALARRISEELAQAELSQRPANVKRVRKFIRKTLSVNGMKAAAAQLDIKLREAAGLRARH